MNKYSLEDLLTSKGYYNNDLNSLISKDFPSSKFIRDPSFETEYKLMRTLAVQEDDFSKVAEVFMSIVRRVHGIDTAKPEAVLREAHQIYINAQKQLARVFGDQGQFDVVQAHLQNACSGLKIEIGYSKEVVLHPEITGDEIDTLTRNALRHTPTEYFLQHVETAMQEGDPQKVDKYAFLSLQSLREKGVIKAPERWRMAGGVPLKDQRQEADVMLQTVFSRLWRKANGVVIGRKIEEAVGYAVREGNYDPYADNSRLEKLRREMQDVVFNVVRRTVPDEKVSDAITGTLLYFDRFFDPAYDQLLACRQDPDHPLRTIYRPKKEKGKVVGFERVPIATTAVVPRSFYEQVFAQRPIPVHPFFNAVVERYASR
ncbi:MAG: hypothetical protein Q8L34_00845 [Candidatus Woesearchaeota archaeon]|nr:hypothetical protein [Candidatus Woesearchaeota archaeon]